MLVWMQKWKREAWVWGSDRWVRRREMKEVKASSLVER